MIFLSDTNIGMHKEYHRALTLKLSIFEKSYPILVGKNCNEILNSKIPKSEREEAYTLKADIMAHEIFFNSFSSQNTVCEIVKRNFGSEASFLYMLYEKCIKNSGFLFIYRNKKEIQYYIGENYQSQLLSNTPILAVDLFEHAYFYDYGFDKRAYLQKALSNLDLSKLNISKRIEKRKK